jgi:hypothetical protein
MRLIVTLAALLLLAVPAAAQAAEPDSKVRRCPTGQDYTQAPPMANDDGTLRIGRSFVWAFARGSSYSGAYEGGYRWKMPILVAAGHTATVRVGAAARAFAGLAYGTGGWGFPGTVRTVTFRACPVRAADRRRGIRRLHFFSGGVVATRSPACIPFSIRVDRGAVRTHLMPVGSLSACG